MSSVTALKASLPLDRLRGGGGFARDPRFAGLFRSPATEPATAAAPEPDPVAEAYRKGFEDGRAEAEAHAAEREREADAQRAAIELSFARFDAASADALRERLRQTVLALCEDAILPLALDAEGLAARVEKAVGMLQRAQDERRVLLHPEDLALIRDRLPSDLELVADPAIERGGLRIDSDDGGIDDGPKQWRRILAEAFGEC